MASIKEHFNKLLWTDENKKVGEEYLKVIRANYKECSERFERGIRALIVAIIALELIVQAVVSEFSFAGLKFHNLVLIQKMLPVAIAYLYYSLATNIINRRLLMDVHQETMMQIHPDLVTQNLHLYVEPPTLFQVERIFEIEIAGNFSKRLRVLTYPLLFSMTLGPIIYLAYTLFRSFAIFGFKDVIVWIALFISTIFLIQVIILFDGMKRITEWQPEGEIHR